VKLHILTAVSRPENLPRIAESLATAAERAPDVQVTWHWRFDLARQHIGGQAVKNAMLDEFHDGWFWALDDDTLTHEDVLLVVDDARRRHPHAKAIIVSQQRSDGRVLPAAPEQMCPGGVDIGQAFLRRDLIGDHRIPEHYNGDGMFLQTVLTGATVVFLPDVVSLHNALSGVEVSV
jgi:hypothetical protein